MLDTVSFRGKKALIRVDFNVPLDENFVVTDATRISAAAPTIKHILAQGGTVILMSHLGRPKRGPEDKYSLNHIRGELEKWIGVPVRFFPDCRGVELRQVVAQLQRGEVLLLENLRFYKEEEEGDTLMAQELAGLGADYYINDAFGTAHRAHASTSIIADFFPPGHKLFGYLMEAEVNNATKILNAAERPFVAILGGAKVSDKILLIENLLDRAQHIIIGGGMAYTFFRAMGGNTGKSLVEEDKLEIAHSLLRKAEEKNVQLHLPADSIIADAFAQDAHIQVCDNMHIPDGWMGLDLGPLAIARFCSVLAGAKTILWNGPMGVFEMQNFQKGTLSVAQAIADATASGAFSLVGGGDSVAAVNGFGLSQRMSYISTGGGAILEFFEGKELPGVKSILG